MDPVTALAALAPIAVEAGKAIVARWIAPDTFKPATIEQWATMQDKSLAMFQAINSAGASGVSYPWVEAVIKLQRPVVVVCVLGTWAASHLMGFASPAIDNAAGIVGFYLFGDRTLLAARNAPGALAAAVGKR